LKEEGKEEKRGIVSALHVKDKNQNVRVYRVEALKRKAWTRARGCAASRFFTIAT
jgi:hypothetical protein